MSTKKTEIDLTKIKNASAINKVEPGFEERMVKAGTQNKVSRFNFTPSELIPLPSGGRLYAKPEITTDPDILKGFVRMKPMTIKEEEILSTSRFAKTGSTTRMIMSRCIESEIDAKDILLYDSNFLMFYLRKISYGDEYGFELTCGNGNCEKKFEHKILISELKFDTLPEDFVEPIEVKLPVSKYTVLCILPRLYHSEETYMKNMNRKKKADEEDRRLTDNILVTTLEILDAEGKKLPRSDWEEFMGALPGRDRAELTKRTSVATGVDKLEGIECPYCGVDYNGTVPVGAEFFRF